jgi:hypothetical protein
VTALDRMLDLLPAPYSVADDSLVSGMLNVCALEAEALEEDIDRVRRSHWIEQAYRDRDIDALAALLDFRRFAGEPAPAFRRRVRALVKARLAGTITVGAIEDFVYDYIRGVEDKLAFRDELKFTLVTGLRGTAPEKAWRADAGRPFFRNLRFVEFPDRVRRGSALADRGGAVTHLFRWSETNRGVDVAPVTFALSGAIGGGTMMPVIIDLTSKTVYGWRGVVPFGRTLILDGAGGKARATLEGVDVTDRFFRIESFAFGRRFKATNIQPASAPVMRRGTTEWLFATIALYDERGYDHVHFMLGDPGFAEGVFDRTAFDRALFAEGTSAWLEMSWIEKEAASFQVRVPRTIVDEPLALIDDFALAGATWPPREEIAADLAATISQLRAAGVRAEVFFDPFTETQRQHDRFEASWVDTPPERASAGEHDALTIGARFGETALGRSRFN